MEKVLVAPRPDDEMQELRLANVRLTRQVRRWQWGTAFVAVALLVGLGFPGAPWSARGQVPDNAAPPRRTPGAHEDKFSRRLGMPPILPMRMLPGTELMKVGRYLISPSSISHSYIDPQGARILFLSGAGSIRLNRDESRIIESMALRNAGSKVEPEGELPPPYDEAPPPYDEAPFTPYDEAPSPYDEATFTPYDEAPSPYDEAPPPYDEAPPPSGELPSPEP